VKARAVDEYLNSLDGGWVHTEHTVDTFKSGDPEADITGIAVGWMSYTWALERALELGCNLFITHEPTYYDHYDKEPKFFAKERLEAKRRFIEESGLVIRRCHDLWDQYKSIGIPDSWAQQLGFAAPIESESFYRVFDVAGRTARSIAEQVAARTAELGQGAVQLVGPADKPVSRLAIGTGAITPLWHYLRILKADMAICSDDGFTYWRDGALCADLGVPAVVVNHPVSEVFGMKLLADHLRARFADVPVHYIEQGCMYELIG
jgi:putative NIF3 family GTP cyclohydrolase 1 type 2